MQKNDILSFQNPEKIIFSNFQIDEDEIRTVNFYALFKFYISFQFYNFEL